MLCNLFIVLIPKYWKSRQQESIFEGIFKPTSTYLPRKLCFSRIIIECIKTTIFIQLCGYVVSFCFYSNLFIYLFLSL